ncbi:MAG TPA: DUF6763 family protein [Steroidobacteraceae bacterium]|nr:DUF6763 family protein [Steroidobacteraceae bacterium]
MQAPTPIIGQWYRGPTGDLFEVVAVDSDDDTIEIQYFDGTLEEYDQETWNTQGIVEADAPEDWTGSVDVDQEDYDVEAETPHNAAWSAPSEFLDRSESSGYSEIGTSAEIRYR